MGIFYVDTATGSVATAQQLRLAGIDDPDAPWLRIQGPSDATTLWHAVLVKEERGIFIGTLTLRHGDHHALLLTKGWIEIEPERIGTSLDPEGRDSTVSPSPWSDPEAGPESYEM